MIELMQFQEFLVRLVYNEFARKVLLGTDSTVGLSHCSTTVSGFEIRMTSDCGSNLDSRWNVPVRTRNQFIYIEAHAYCP